MALYYWKKYGTATTIDFPLVQPAGVDFEVSATFATGDCKISKNGGAAANTTNLPVDSGLFYSLTLTAAEMTASRVMITLIDSATKVWLDEAIIIETYGDASAGIDVLVPPADTSLCAVALYPSVDAVASTLSFAALPNQVVSSRMVDITPVVATVVSSTIDYYQADLVRKAQYLVKTNRFACDDVIVTIPDSGTANLADLITGARAL